MVDVGTHHFVKASAGGHSVLVPQPSDDEHDPLVSRSLLTIRSGADDRSAELVSYVEGFGHFLLDISLVLARHGAIGIGSYI